MICNFQYLYMQASVLVTTIEMIDNNNSLRPGIFY